MKYLASSFALCTWLVITFVLVISIIGMFGLLFIKDEWMDIGRNLVSILKDKED